MLTFVIVIIIKLKNNTDNNYNKNVNDNDDTNKNDSYNFSIYLKLPYIWGLATVYHVHISLCVIYVTDVSYRQRSQEHQGTSI